MFIGTSLGKCLKSILDGDVKEERVLFIVSNTDCPDLPRLMDVVDDYYHMYQGETGIRATYDLSSHRLEDAKELATRLMADGKLHQPRAVGATHWGNAHSLKDTWYEIVPTPSTHDHNVLDAWSRYQLLAGLIL